VDEDDIRRIGRRTVLGSTAALAAGLMLGCSSSSSVHHGSTTTAPAGQGAGARASNPDDSLAKPGTPGLMDETVFQQRVQDYLELATAQPTTNLSGVASFLIRSKRDPSFRWDPNAITVDSFADSWQRIDQWQDTRDFDLMYMQWLLALGQGSTATTRLPTAVIDAIRDRMLANRYRYDDPLPKGRIDNQWFWSENHRLIVLMNEYLAGQRYPDAMFAVTGLTGAQHHARAHPEILEWIHERGQLGFFEWHSNVYMLKDVSPLLTLVELSDDADIVTGAAMALDLCLMDMASHLQAGCFTAPRGRTYKKDKMSSLDEDTFCTQKFVFDDTKADYPSTNDGGATYLCAAKRYRPPQVMVSIATDDRTTVVRERHGVFFDDRSPVTDHPKAPFGRDFENLANLRFWWSLGAIGMWPMARASVRAANEFKLWDTDQFSQIKLLASLNQFDPEKIRVWEQARAAVIDFGYLGEANTYAYRNTRVSLASVLDHRFGEMRDQIHSWQAAIDENAMMFTTHPVTDVDHSTNWEDDGKPGYWTGEATVPRSAQFERTAIHIYQPAWDKSTDPLVWTVFEYRQFTHAYVPQDHFDAIRQVGHWTIGERSGGYIALWSWRKPTWRVYDPAVIATRGMKKPFDLVADGGPDNVWIVEVGRQEDDGDLDRFVASLTAHDPEVTRDAAGFTVAWDSPSAGRLEFGSTGAFRVRGAEQALHGFPRHESPWGKVDHLSSHYELAAGGTKWSLAFDSLTRSVSKG
jgi:hypothetical protein